MDKKQSMHVHRLRQEDAAMHRRDGRHGIRPTMSVFILLMILTMILSGCGAGGSGDSAANPQSADPKADVKKTTDIFAMTTQMTLTAYGSHADEALKAATKEIQQLDEMLSISSDKGDIYKVNQSKSQNVSEETAALIERSLEVSEMTEGAFDITILPLMQEWGFTDENYKVPDEDTLETVRTGVDYRNVNVSGTEVSLDSTTSIDLGGIAKGYTSAKIIDIMKDHGVSSAIVSLGGNVQSLGTKPDGSLWRVALQDPENPDGYFGVLESRDQAIITSGGYERYFEKGGKTWHHILDPTTGYPADSGILSSTIISADGTLADGLSTALYVMGLDRAEALWKEHSDEFDFVLMDDDGTVYVTEGVVDNFKMENGGEPTILRK